MSAKEEQRALDRQAKLAFIARVRRAAETNPDLTWEALGERFDLDPKTVGRWCQDMPRDAPWWNNERSRKSA